MPPRSQQKEKPAASNRSDSRDEDGLPMAPRRVATAAVLAAIVLVVIDSAVANVALHVKGTVTGTAPKG